MSLTDYVIPPWVRWVVLGVLAGIVFGAGIKAGQFLANQDVQAANRDRDKAITARDKAATDLATYRAEVKAAGADQATQAAQQTINQTHITQESTHAYIETRSRLEQRLADRRVRHVAPGAGNSGGRSFGTTAESAARAADATAQPVSADAGGDAEAVSQDVAAEVPTQSVIDRAAFDAQQLAHLIDAACKLGLCAEP